MVLHLFFAQGVEAIFLPAKLWPLEFSLYTLLPGISQKFIARYPWKITLTADHPLEFCGLFPHPSPWISKAFFTPLPWIFHCPHPPPPLGFPKPFFPPPPGFSISPPPPPPPPLYKLAIQNVEWTTFFSKTIMKSNAYLAIAIFHFQSLSSLWMFSLYNMNSSNVIIMLSGENRIYFWTLFAREDLISRKTAFFCDFCDGFVLFLVFFLTILIFE